ncbi:uncharacterized protein LOC111265444 isoform X1 [Varroa jacobsoni]|uniref:uncharacterized protein LOC111265444 isoform X1 n=1 Tax=Varroa jacobsoni TaxID=62625 RepID=UPI000BF37254|nr:uncharacterized protein LOC111265444 isoform X1 [Varroa jacobsoni]
MLCRQAKIRKGIRKCYANPFRSKSAIGRIILKRHPTAIRHRSVCVNERCHVERAQYRDLNHQLAKEVNLLRESEEAFKTQQLLLEKLAIKYAQCRPWIQAIRLQLEAVSKQLDTIERVTQSCSSVATMRAFVLNEDTFPVSLEVDLMESLAELNKGVTYRPEREYFRFGESLSTIMESIPASGNHWITTTLSEQLAQSDPVTSQPPAISRTTANSETHDICGASDRVQEFEVRLQLDECSKKLAGNPDSDNPSCNVDKRSRRKKRMLFKKEKDDNAIEAETEYVGDVHKQPGLTRTDQKDKCGPAVSSLDSGLQPITEVLDIVITSPSMKLLSDSSESDHLPLQHGDPKFDKTYLKPSTSQRKPKLTEGLPNPGNRKRDTSQKTILDESIIIVAPGYHNESTKGYSPFAHFAICTSSLSSAKSRRRALIVEPPEPTGSWDPSSNDTASSGNRRLINDTKTNNYDASTVEKSNTKSSLDNPTGLVAQRRKHGFVMEGSRHIPKMTKEAAKDRSAPSTIFHNENQSREIGLGRRSRLSQLCDSTFTYKSFIGTNIEGLMASTPKDATPRSELLQDSSFHLSDVVKNSWYENVQGPAYNTRSRRRAGFEVIC